MRHTACRACRVFSLFITACCVSECYVLLSRVPVAVWGLVELHGVAGPAVVATVGLWNGMCLRVHVCMHALLGHLCCVCCRPLTCAPLQVRTSQAADDFIVLDMFSHMKGVFAVQHVLCISHMDQS